MEKILVFIVISAVLVFISRASLRVPGSHGFFRFFAWEAMLVLFIINVNALFHQPFSIYQILSWLLLCIALIYLFIGGILLLLKGKPDTHRDDVPLFDFEKTTVLITDGIYRYIRHPLYGSLLFLAWGIFFKALSWPGFFLVIISTIFLFLTARQDEMECIHYFGPAYQKYMQHTKMFIPYLF